MTEPNGEGTGAATTRPGPPTSGRATSRSRQRSSSTTERASAADGRERDILDAAARLFHERGFHRVGVDEIGQLAGITGPAIYRHFSGKDEILAALFDSALDRLLLMCGRLPEDPFTALEALIAAHAEFAIQDRALLSVYTREERSLSEPWRRALLRRRREHLERWLAVVARCFPDRPAIEREAAIQAALGTVHSVAVWPHSARSGIDLSAALVSFVRGGLGSLGPWRPDQTDAPAGEAMVRPTPQRYDNHG